MSSLWSHPLFFSAACSVKRESWRWTLSGLRRSLRPSPAARWWIWLWAAREREYSHPASWWLEPRTVEGGTQHPRRHHPTHTCLTRAGNWSGLRLWVKEDVLCDSHLWVRRLAQAVWSSGQDTDSGLTWSPWHSWWTVSLCGTITHVWIAMPYKLLFLWLAKLFLTNYIISYHLVTTLYNKLNKNKYMDMYQIAA